MSSRYERPASAPEGTQWPNGHEPEFIMSGGAWQPVTRRGDGYHAGWVDGIKHVELSLMRKLERPDVRRDDDQWNDVITALQQVRELFPGELAT